MLKLFWTAIKVDPKAAGGVVVDENDTLAILFYHAVWDYERHVFSRNNVCILMIPVHTM